MSELPALPKWQYKNLKESIRRYGVLMPVLQSEDGEIIDGRERVKICKELSIKLDNVVTIANLSEAEKWDHRLIANLVCRRLTSKQRRKLIAEELKNDPHWSNRAIAYRMNTTDKTVASVREELLAGAEIPQVFMQIKGQDGKEYTRKPTPRILSTTPAEHEQALELATAGIPLSVGGKLLPVKTVAKRVKRAARSAEIAGAKTQALTFDDFELHNCRFQDLEIEPESVDMVFVDPPWNNDFLPELSELGRFAEKVLKPGGHLALYYGCRNLRHVVSLEDGLMHHVATASINWKGKGCLMFADGGSVIDNWRPIYIFAKGTWAYKTRWSNSYHYSKEEYEKDFHEWQQPLSPVRHFVRLLSEPGWLICDPCFGACTTGIACYQLDRRFIGCDRDPNTLAIGKERLEAAKAEREKPQPALVVGSRL